MRELKRRAKVRVADAPYRRTPPGVRELKQGYPGQGKGAKGVAPLPGCVN